MKLIPRRRKSPTTFERVVGYVKLGAKGLAAQRLVRRSLKGYRFTKRAIPLAGLAALGAFIAKRRGGAATPPAYTPPASAGPSAGTTAGAAATAATGTPPADDGASAAPDVPPAPTEVAADASPGAGSAASAGASAADAPADTDSSPGTGSAAGADASAADAADTPPADAGGTEDALGVEAPNQSTPPPPGSTKT